MKKANIVIMFGGGGKEHDISILTSKYLTNHLDKLNQYNTHSLLLNHKGQFINENKQVVFIGPEKEIIIQDNGLLNPTGIMIDYIIPCFHGTPGETGEIQAFINQHNIPYLGCNQEANILSFNKVSTKLWLDNIGIPTTPFIFLDQGQNNIISLSRSFFDIHNDIFIKAASEGSAFGVYHCTKKEELEELINQAFAFSTQVLLEKTNQGRELELSCFEYKSKLHITRPGEIICNDDFYDYEQKYDSNSSTTTDILAKNIPEDTILILQQYAKKAFLTLGLKDLSRIDFFLNENNQICLNEVNTFPGMTPISMFPKMMEKHGVKFQDFLVDRINCAISKGQVK